MSILRIQCNAIGFKLCRQLYSLATVVSLLKGTCCQGSDALFALWVFVWLGCCSMSFIVVLQYCSPRSLSEQQDLDVNCPETYVASHVRPQAKWRNSSIDSLFRCVVMSTDVWWINFSNSTFIVFQIYQSHRAVLTKTELAKTDPPCRPTTFNHSQSTPPKNQPKKHTVKCQQDQKERNSEDRAEKGSFAKRDFQH